MAQLSAADVAFLEKHKIPLSSAFDASGMTTREWKAAMKEEGKFVAYGVTCIRDHIHGQALKTRSNNCIRCNTANIAFARRAAKDGHVYIAWSAKRLLVKVGYSASDPENRIYIGNLEGYARANDWRIHECVYAANAGRVELDVHTMLKDFHAPQLWERNWVQREARETYACGLSQAIITLHSQLCAR